MLEGAFSFRGRIGRLNYFLASLMMVPAILVAVVFIGILMANAQRGIGSLLFFGVLFLLVGIGALWFSLSLYVRRIRDIGWDPATVLIGWLMIIVGDVVLARIVPAMAVGHGGSGTLIGGLVNLALTLILLFWPGRDVDISEVFAGPPLPASRLDALVGGAGAPTPAMAAPARLPGGPRQGFGRRGVR